MKKVLLSLFLLISGMAVNAQEIVLNERGAYEKKIVVIVDSTKASILYDRALEALSDWTGVSGKAQAGLDYHDRDAGTVIYKGHEYIGFKNVFLGDGWERYADFILKVKCKDGRAQITTSIPTITFRYNKNGMKRNYTAAEVTKAVEDAKGKKKERGIALLADIKELIETISIVMSNRLKNASIFGDDDDF